MRTLIIMTILMVPLVSLRGQGNGGSRPPGARAAELPADIYADSLSRLPSLKREDLDDVGKKVFDQMAGSMSLMGPAGTSLYSPRAAEAQHALNQYLRNESVLGTRYFELCVLIAAREFDQRFEWAMHEPAARKAGIEQPVIDAVKYNRPVPDLAERDRVVIELGRDIFRRHELSSSVFQKAVELFGRKGLVELTTIMGNYAMAAVTLTAIDQQVPPDRQGLLPPR